MPLTFNKNVLKPRSDNNGGEYLKSELIRFVLTKASLCKTQFYDERSSRMNEPNFQ